MSFCYDFNVNFINMVTMPLENRTARLTILIDPRKKKIFEEICAIQDVTPSQIVRRLIRQWIIDNAAGRELPPWLLRASGGER
jgi:hypothetical protein